MYERLKFLAFCGALVVIAACAGKTEDQDKKLDDIVSRLDRIEKKLDNVGTRARPPPPPPGEQVDPKAVYSVPIEGSPFIGPAVAKVTIVEASDFA